MLVETKNRTLEETAALFDHKDLAQEIMPIIEAQQGKEKDIQSVSEKDIHSVLEKASEARVEIMMT